MYNIKKCCDHADSMSESLADGLSLIPSPPDKPDIMLTVMVGAYRRQKIILKKLRRELKEFVDL